MILLRLLLKTNFNSIKIYIFTRYLSCTLHTCISYLYLTLLRISKLEFVFQLWNSNHDSVSNFTYFIIVAKSNWFIFFVNVSGSRKMLLVVSFFVNLLIHPSSVLFISKYLHSLVTHNFRNLVKNLTHVKERDYDRAY